MYKRFISVALTFALTLSLGAAAFAEGEEQPLAEEITEPPIVISQKQFDYFASNNTYTTVDLSPYTNREFRDEAAGDGKGGWTDQGSRNDLSSLTLRGINKLKGVPFNIIEPDNNNGTSLILLRGRNDAVLPTRVEIPVNQTVGGAYFLHAASWGDGKECGKYSLVYEDGSSSFVRIVEQKNIRDFWRLMENEYMVNAWHGYCAEAAAQGGAAYLNMFAFDNPHPEKTVKSLVLESDGSIDYIGIIAVTLTTGKAYLAGDAVNQNPLTSGWIDYSEMKNDGVTAGSPLDASVLLGAPAGKHGALRADGSELKFEDGTEFRLWGTNVKGSACFPTKEKAEAMAQKIAACGYNMVRFSNLDYEKTHDLSSDKLDRLAYFINELGKRGVYTFLSLSLNIEDNKPAQFFHSALIEQQAGFAEKIMAYESPYTKQKLAVDKSIAMLEFAEENSMFAYTSGYGKYALTDKEYRKELQALFTEYLKGFSTAALRAQWGNNVTGLIPGTSVEAGNILLDASWRYSLCSKGKKETISKFLAKVEDDFYNTLSDTVEKLGYQGLKNVSSGVVNKSDLQSVFARQGYDFTSASYIWEYIGNSDAIYDGKYCAAFSSMYADKYLGIIGAAARNRTGNQPYVIARYGCPQPNVFASQGDFAMAAYAGRNNWYPIADCFADGDLEDKYYIADCFSAATNPVKLAAAPALAYMYRYMDRQEITKVGLPAADVWGGAELAIPNKTLLGQNTVFEPLSGAAAVTHVRHDSEIANGSVTFNGAKQTLRVNTDMVQAFSGKTDDAQFLKNMSFDVYNANATIILVPLDGKSIAKSERLLLSATGVCRNKNMEVTKSYIASVGESCAMAEPVNAAFTLRTGGEYEIYSLNDNGGRIEKLDCSRDNNGNTLFDINMNVTTNAVNFEIVRTK